MKASRILFSAFFILLAGHAVWPEELAASEPPPAPEAAQVGSIHIRSTQRSKGKTVIKNSYMHRVPATERPKVDNFLGLDIERKIDKKKGKK